eukprot:2177038-Pyramimonas_sp.AAC.1
MAREQASSKCTAAFVFTHPMLMRAFYETFAPRSHITANVNWNCYRTERCRTRRGTRGKLPPGRGGVPRPVQNAQCSRPILTSCPTLNILHLLLVVDAYDTQLLMTQYLLLDS